MTTITSCSIKPRNSTFAFKMCIFLYFESKHHIANKCISNNLYQLSFSLILLQQLPHHPPHHHRLNTGSPTTLFFKRSLPQTKPISGSIPALNLCATAAGRSPWYTKHNLEQNSSRSSSCRVCIQGKTSRRVIATAVPLAPSLSSSSSSSSSSETHSTSLMRASTRDAKASFSSSVI